MDQNALLDDFDITQLVSFFCFVLLFFSRQGQLKAKFNCGRASPAEYNTSRP